MSNQPIHEIVDGFCRQCGDTEEWLRSRGERLEYITTNTKGAAE